MLPGKKYRPTDFVEIAWRRRWIIALPVVACGFAALVVSSRLPNVYQSEMLIQIVPQRVPDSYVRSTVTMRTEERLDALSQQVLSRTELERLIGQLNLYPEEQRQLPLQDVVEHMRANANVELLRSGREADAFYVRFMYPDPDLATRVTERLGALFIEVNSRDRGALADATNDFLQTQLALARGRLEDQEQKLEQFRLRNSGRLPSQLEFNMQAIQNTQLQLQALVESLARDRDRKLMLERLYNDAQAEPTPVPPPAAAPAGAPPAADPTSAAGATPAEQLALTREVLQRLELRLRPEHPDVLRTKRSISELEARVRERGPMGAATAGPVPVAAPEQRARRERVQQMAAEIESLDRQIAFKEAEEQRLRRSVADYQSRIEQVPGMESEWISLTRDYETQQAAYKDLLSKSEQSKVAADLEKRQIGEQLRVLDPARPPGRPVGIARLQVNAGGALAGLVFGLMIAALLELRDTSYRTAEDVVTVLKLPVLAVVPYATTEADRSGLRRTRWLASGAAGVLLTAGAYVAWTLQLWKYIK